jgi:hypothetical protein
MSKVFQCKVCSKYFICNEQCTYNKLNSKCYCDECDNTSVQFSVCKTKILSEKKAIAYML